MFSLFTLFTLGCEGILEGQSCQSRALPSDFSFLYSFSPRRCRSGALAPQLLPRTVFFAKFFKIRTPAKHTCKSRRIRSFKTLNIKSFRIRS